MLSRYSLGSKRKYHKNLHRKQYGFYPNCISEWNKLDPEIRLAPSVAVFKKKLLSIIRPPAKSVFGIHDPIGLSYLTQIRVGLSKLKFHKFRHGFRDTIDPMCQTNDGIEDTEHFLLLWPSFDIQRRDLLAGVSELLRPYVRINSLPNNALIQILLYGDKDFSIDVNKNVLKLTLNFIDKTGRFNLSGLKQLLYTFRIHTYTFPPPPDRTKSLFLLSFVSFLLFKSVSHWI